MIARNVYVTRSVRVAVCVGGIRMVEMSRRVPCVVWGNVSGTMWGIVWGGA